MKWKKSLASFFALFIPTLILIFSHWESSGESWIYWFFARVFSETGSFIVLDRSPLYTLYLNLFRGLPYPISTTLEFVVLALFVSIVLTLFFNKFTTRSIALIGAVLWLPFLTRAEPSVQSIGLAFCILGVLFRLSKVTSWKVSLSYAMFMIAFLLRPSYIITIFTFVIWDVVTIFREKKNRRIFYQPILILPMIILITALLWFSSAQSTHPLNTPGGATITWFPYNSTSLTTASFIQTYNWFYIQEMIGSFENQDFYFTNQKYFNGASTISEMVEAQPIFVFSQIGRNYMRTLRNIGRMTLLVFPFAFFPDFIETILGLSVLLAIIYFSFAFFTQRLLRVFLLSLLLQIMMISIFLPGQRHMVPLVPIFILASLGLLQWIHLQFGMRNILVAVLCFIVFSNGLISWGIIGNDLIRDSAGGDLQILERRDNSMKAIQPALSTLTSNCTGVMSLEYLFIGSFTPTPVNKIYDVWEVPPIKTEYHGLYPERISCLHVSPALSEGIGYGTNWQLRYDLFLQPYSIQIIENGGSISSLQYGEFIRAKH